MDLVKDNGNKPISTTEVNDIENGNLENKNRETPTQDYREPSNNNNNNNQIELRMAFKALDKDKDGVLSKEEMRAGMRELCPNMSARMFDVMFEEADKNSDGVLSFSEFCRVMSL